MGLLDSLHYGNQGGYGGLLDMLMYQGPLHNQGQQAQPDTMAGLMPPAPDSGWARPNPFDAPPPIVPSAPPSVFNAGTAPVMGLASGAPSAPPLPPAQNISSAPQAATPPQVNDMQIGGYSMPRMGAVSDYTPQATDFSAQSRPQQPFQLPPALSQPEGGFSGALKGFANNLHTGPIGALVGGIGGAAGMQSPERQNMRAQFEALSQIVGPRKAMIAVLNPKAGESIFAEAFGKDPPKTVEEFAVRQAWDARRGGGAPGAGGSAAGSGMPTTLADLEKYKIDQKAAEKKATTMAEEQGKLTTSLPDTMARAEQTIKQIDELKGHTAKSYRTGFSSILPGVPGTAGVDFDERVKQLKGGAFLDAYKMLRGTGAISEAEGIKAEQAQARLSQAKTAKDFDQALDDLRQVVVDGYARAQQMAGSDTVKSYETPIGQSRNIGGVTIKRIK